MRLWHCCLFTDTLTCPNIRVHDIEVRDAYMRGFYTGLRKVYAVSNPDMILMLFAGTSDISQIN